MCDRQAGAGASGYRASHLDKGTTYDTVLAADPYDAYISALERTLILRIVDQLFPKGVSQYLDFACGTGRVAAIIEALADHAYGVDVSDTMLSEARGKCRRTEFVRMDMTRDRLAVGPVDLVSAFRFFGNAEDELRASALKAISDVLRPGGYLLVNNHRNPQSIRNLLLRLTGTRVVEDLHYWKLRRLLSDHGFRIVRTFGIAFWVVRARWAGESVLNSRAARLLEPLSRFRPLGPFCPDAVLLAQKTGA